MKIRNEWIENSKIDKEKYLSMYDESIRDGDKFWEKQADRIKWNEKFTKIKNMAHLQSIHLML